MGLEYNNRSIFSNILVVLVVVVGWWDGTSLVVVLEEGKVELYDDDDDIVVDVSSGFATGTCCDDGFQVLVVTVASAVPPCSTQWRPLPVVLLVVRFVVEWLWYHCRRSSSSRSRCWYCGSGGGDCRDNSCCGIVVMRQTRWFHGNHNALRHDTTPSSTVTGIHRDPGYTNRWLQLPLQRLNMFSLSLSLSLSLSGTLALCTRVDAFLSRQNEKNSSLEHSRYVCCAHKTHTRVDTFLSRYAINRMNRIEQSRTTVLEYYRGIWR